MEEQNKKISDAALLTWYVHAPRHAGIALLLLLLLYFVGRVLSFFLVGWPDDDWIRPYLLAASTFLAVLLGIKLSQLFFRRYFTLENKTKVLLLSTILFAAGILGTMVKLKIPFFHIASFAIPFNTALFYLLSAIILKEENKESVNSEESSAVTTPSLSPSKTAHPNMLLLYKIVTSVLLFAPLYAVSMDLGIKAIILVTVLIGIYLLIYRFISHNLKDWWGYTMVLFTAAYLAASILLFLSVFTAEYEGEGLELLFLFLFAIPLVAWAIWGVVISSYLIFYQPNMRPKILRIFMYIYLVISLLPLIWPLWYFINNGSL